MRGTANVPGQNHEVGIHAAQHKTGGSDPLTAADVGGLPLDGSAAMTGHLIINTAEDTGHTMLIDANTFALLAKVFGKNHAQFIANAADNTAWFNYSVDGGVTFVQCQLLHTGNFADHALPRDGSAAMTGDLVMSNGTIGALLRVDQNNNANFALVNPSTKEWISGISLEAGKLLGVFNDAWVEFLHTGNVTAGTTDLTAGTSALATGAMHLVYE